MAKRILDCDRHFRDRCLLRALGYRLGARPIQKHALPSGGVSGHYWWRAGADRGNPDRRIVIRQLHSNITEVALGDSRGASRKDAAELGLESVFLRFGIRLFKGLISSVNSGGPYTRVGVRMDMLGRSGMAIVALSGDLDQTSGSAGAVN
jgi:hypothetical protein